MVWDFTSNTGSCPAAHRHGIMLQKTHCTTPSPITNKLRPPSYIFLNSFFMTFRIFVSCKKHQRKPALEPCCKRHYQVLLKTKTVVKLQGVTPWVHVSQLEKQNSTRTGRLLLYGDLKLRIHRDPLGVVNFQKWTADPSPLEQVELRLRTVSTKGIGPTLLYNSCFIICLLQSFFSFL